MAWHDHPLLWKATAKALDLKGKPEQAIPLICESIARPGRFGGNVALQLNTLADLRSELHWIEADRPYYDLYPSVAEAFTKVNLAGLKCEQVSLPLPNLLIRLKIGHELKAGRSRIRSIFVSQTKGVIPFIRREEGLFGPTGPEAHTEVGMGLMVRFDDGSIKMEAHQRFPIHTLSCVTFKEGHSIEDRLTSGRLNPYIADDKSIDYDAIETAFRIVCAICLLKDNPDLIEPMPLDADKAKWEETHDWKLIEKAERRGKRGWAVGRHIEVAPGFRRPHFAIRWCGKGRTDPRLRPIKGCLVRRRVIEEVPTGYLDEVIESQESKNE